MVHDVALFTGYLVLAAGGLLAALTVGLLIPYIVAEAIWRRMQPAARTRLITAWVRREIEIVDGGEAKL